MNVMETFYGTVLAASVHVSVFMSVCLSVQKLTKKLLIRN